MKNFIFNGLIMPPPFTVIFKITFAVIFLTNSNFASAESSIGSKKSIQGMTVEDRALRTGLSTRLSNYTQEKADGLKNTVLADIDAFSKLELNDPIDLPLVRNIFLVLLLLVEMDPGQETVFTLSKSYISHSQIYKKVFEKMILTKSKKLTPTQIKQLKDIMMTLEKLSTSGNG